LRFLPPRRGGPFPHALRPPGGCGPHGLHPLPRRPRALPERAAFPGEGRGACLDCHTEKAGPFVFPHAPQRLDGCLSCHTPHGSANPRLLVRRQVADLCLECHSRVPAFHDLSRGKYRDCTRCHAEVHGSNRSPVFFQE
ncbi:MAG: cytochrome c3 family protein, partial [Acidobacteriota bacterium]